MKRASEIEKELLGAASFFLGEVGEAKLPFADCVLAFPDTGKVHSSWSGVSVCAAGVVSEILAAKKAMEEDASVWIWAKDMYIGGGLAMLPQKIVLRLIFDNEWIVRNEVAWECKVADPAPENRLKRSYETAFHLSTGMGYFYDRTMGAGKKKGPTWKNGIPSSRTGVVGKKYARYINESAHLSEDEKTAARLAMIQTLDQLNAGEISDYRLAIRGIHKVSGSREREVASKGFSISKTRMHGLPVSDLWRDARGVSNKSMPKELALMMVKLTCRPDGVVLDLFPSEAVAEAVIASGRRYVAVSTDEVLLAKMEGALLTNDAEGNLFEEASGNEETKESIESRDTPEGQGCPCAQEAVQEAQGEPEHGAGC